jgi:hypothetical protein
MFRLNINNTITWLSATLLQIAADAAAPEESDQMFDKEYLVPVPISYCMLHLIASHTYAGDGQV